MAVPGGVTESLEEKLRKQREGGTRMIRGAGGQLEEVSGEEVSTLAGKLGQPTPSTPVGTASMGTTPDQAKMAGTPAQQAGAAAAPAVDIQAQAATEQTQAGAQRLRDVSKMQADAGQQAKLEKSQNLQNLGALGDRVYKMMLGGLSAGAQAGAEQNARLEVDTAGAQAALPTTATPEQKQQVADLMTQLEAAGRSGDSAQVQKLMADLTNAGVANPHTYLSGDAAAAVAKSAPELQTIGSYNQSGQLDSVAQQLGYSDFGQVSELLGISPEEMQNYKLGDLNDLIQQELDKEFSQTEQLKQAATDPNASPQMRAEARARLQELGVVGIRASEAEVDALQQELTAGTKMNIGGQEYTMEELLGDENISSLAQSYFDMDEQERAEFAKQNPDLANFFGKHEAVLQDAADAMGEEYAGFQRTQEANTKAAGALTTAIPSDVFTTSFLAKGTPVGDFMSQFFGPDGKMLASGTNLAEELSKNTSIPAGTKQILSELLDGKYNANQIANMTKLFTDLSAAGLDPMGQMTSKVDFDTLVNLPEGDRSEYVSILKAGIPKNKNVDTIDEVDTYLDSLFGSDFPLTELRDKANSGIPGALELYQSTLYDLGFDPQTGKPSVGLGDKLAKMTIADKLKFKKGLAGRLSTYTTSVKDATKPEEVKVASYDELIGDNSNAYRSATDSLNNLSTGKYGSIKNWSSVSRGMADIIGIFASNKEATGKGADKLRQEAFSSLKKGFDAIAAEIDAQPDKLGNLANPKAKWKKKPAGRDVDAALQAVKRAGMDPNDPSIKKLLTTAEGVRKLNKLITMGGV